MSKHFTPIDLQRCAEALDTLGEDIEKIAHRLCLDPAVMDRHMTELQDFDRIVQYHRALANVFRAELCSHELARSGLDELITALHDFSD